MTLALDHAAMMATILAASLHEPLFGPMSNQTKRLPACLPRICAVPPSQGRARRDELTVEDPCTCLFVSQNLVYVGFECVTVHLRPAAR